MVLALVLYRRRAWVPRPVVLARVRVRTRRVLVLVRVCRVSVVVLAPPPVVSIDVMHLLVVVRVVLNIPPSLSVVRVTEFVPLTRTRCLRSRVDRVVPLVWSWLLSRPSVRTTLINLAWCTRCSLWLGTTTDPLCKKRLDRVNENP